MNDSKAAGRTPKFMRDLSEQEAPNMSENNTAEQPKARGLREASMRAAELREKMRTNQQAPDEYNEFYISPTVIPELPVRRCWIKNKPSAFLAPASLRQLNAASANPMDPSTSPHLNR